MAGGRLVAVADGAAAPEPAGRDTAPARRLTTTRLGLLLFGVLGLVRAGWLLEEDPFWQIRTGEQIVRTGSVFLTDTFSWTVAGRPWHPNSWLFDVLLWAVYRAGGRFGLGLLVVVLVMALGAALGAAARVLGAGAGAFAVTAALLGVPLVDWLGGRPQLASYLLLPVVVQLAGRAVWWRGRRLVLALAGLYLLSALWVNLHLAALAAVPAVASGLAAVVVAHRRSWRRGLPASAAVLASLLLGCASSPLGLGVLTSAAATRDASTTLILEWAPVWRATPMAALTWAVALAGCGVGVAAWRRRPEDRLLPMWVGAAGAMLALGADAIRFAPMALVLIMPLVAARASAVDWSAGRLRRRAAFLGRHVAVAWVVALLLIGVADLGDFGRPSPRMFPTAATIAAIPAGCRVLNEQDDGGPLILQRASDGVRVASDGRNDVYGIDLIDHLQRLILGAPGALSELQRSGVGCLLLEPNRALVAQARAAGWHQAAADPHRVLLLAPRTGP